MDSPKTLLAAINLFSDPENCRQFMVSVRWPNGVVRCPTCGSEKVTYMEKSRLYNCRTKHAKQKFSLKVGTIFEDSPIGLEKWLCGSSLRQRMGSVRMSFTDRLALLKRARGSCFTVSASQ